MILHHLVLDTPTLLALAGNRQVSALIHRAHFETDTRLWVPALSLLQADLEHRGMAERAGQLPVLHIVDLDYPATLAVTALHHEGAPVGIAAALHAARIGICSARCKRRISAQSYTSITHPPGLTQRARPSKGVTSQSPGLVHFSKTTDTCAVQLPRGRTFMDTSDAGDDTDAARATGAHPARPAAPEPAGKEAAGLPSERLLLFTDAVTAISLTLLVLPLVDLVPEAASEDEHARDVIFDHLDQIGSFLLSFAVVARFWFAHHRVYSTVGSLNRSLTVWNMGWLLCIVILPLPTEMVGSFGSDRFAATFYYLTLLASMVCQMAMLRVLTSHSELLTDDGQKSRALVASSYSEAVRNIVALVAALVIALAVPALQYYSLVLLATTPWMARLGARYRYRYRYRSR
ncbi:TMEM175 family protein [Streptomyces sp. NPDC050439]|uniref:TMEM175 family protein n=1 Tax=unclassified Streptomyces TaxID=2593676 RepID=UPI0034138CF3